MPTFESVTGHRAGRTEGTGQHPVAQGQEPYLATPCTASPYPASVLPPQMPTRNEDTLSVASSFTAIMPNTGVYINQLVERYDHKGHPDVIDVEDFRAGGRKPRHRQYDDGEDQIPFFYRSSRKTQGDIDHFMSSFLQYTQEFEASGTMPYAHYIDHRDRSKLSTIVSRKLAYLLRHNLSEFDVTSSAAVKVRDLLKSSHFPLCQQHPLTWAHAIHGNDKKRFAIEDDGRTLSGFINLRVRANQGGSYDPRVDETDYTTLLTLDNVSRFLKSYSGCAYREGARFSFHGTNKERMQLIWTTELKKMGRTKVQSSAYLPKNSTEVSSGFKEQRQLIIFGIPVLDLIYLSKGADQRTMRKLREYGLESYVRTFEARVSENGVILLENVPRHFLMSYEVDSGKINHGNMISYLSREAHLVRGARSLDEDFREECNAYVIRNTQNEQYFNRSREYFLDRSRFPEEIVFHLQVDESVASAWEKEDCFGTGTRSSKADQERTCGFKCATT